MRYSGRDTPGNWEDAKSLLEDRLKDMIDEHDRHQPIPKNEQHAKDVLYKAYSQQQSRRSGMLKRLDAVAG